MIKAETVHSVFLELSQKEKERFFRMCGMVPSKPRRPKRKAVGMTDAEATEYLLKKVFSKKKVP